MFIREEADAIRFNELVAELRSQNTNTVKVDYDIYKYIGPYPNLFPMTNFYGSVNRATKLNLENQRVLSVRWLEEHEVRRRYEWIFDIIHWKVAVVFFNEEPICVLRSPDTREDGYSKMFIIDRDNHQRATSFIFSNMESDPGPELEMYGLDAPSGSFAGDVQPHVRSAYGDPAEFLDYTITNVNGQHNQLLEYIINYTFDPHVDKLFFFNELY